MSRRFHANHPAPPDHRLRWRLALAGAALVATASASAPALAAPAPTSTGIQYKVLVFTKATAEKHASTSGGVNAIKQLGNQFRFTVEVTDDARKFDDPHLKQFRTVIFLNTSGQGELLRCGGPQLESGATELQALGAVAQESQDQQYAPEREQNRTA